MELIKMAQPPQINNVFFPIYFERYLVESL